MRLGNSKFFFIFLFFIYLSPSQSEDKILTTPLINLNELKPSFEEIEDINEDSITYNDEIKQKKKMLRKKDNLVSAQLTGLDKITAKKSDILINLGETKKFGPLEIKVLKCGKTNSKNKNNSVAYLQVKDISKNENEKVFIFNGWTFSSDPTIAPFDHAIYDIQLVNCNNT